MLNACNGQERTIHEFRELLETTGWNLVSVVKPSGARIANPLLIAIPEPLKARRITSYP